MEHNDSALREVMKMAKVEMPFDDFEDNLMQRIEQVELEKSQIVRSKKMALIFFSLGALFAMGMNYLMAELVESSTRIPLVLKSNMMLFSQIIYVALIVIFSDKVWQLRKWVKSN